MEHRKWYSINYKMLPAKISYFFFMGRSEYLPFMLIYLKELGLDTRKASLVNGLHLLGNVVGGPAITYIADKFNVHRKVVRIISVLSLIVMTLVPFVSSVIPKANSNQCFHKEHVVITNRNVTLLKNNSVGAKEIYRKAFEEEKLFYLMLLLFFFASFFGDGLIGFIESATVEKCAIEPKSSYSNQRIFGTIGTPFSVFLIGLFVDYFPLSQITCYSGMFISNVFIMVPLIISCEFLMRNVTFGNTDHSSEVSKQETWSVVKETLRQPKIVLFIATVTIQGMMQGVFMNFTFLYFKELNASNSYLTLYIVLTSLGTGIALLVSRFTVDKVRNTWLIFLLTCSSYAIRYLMFYVTTNLWILFLSGVLQAANGAFSVTKIRFVKEECPKQVATTFYGITTSCYRSLGFVTVNIFGGLIYNEYGGKFLFLCASILALVWSFVILIYMLFTTLSSNKYVFKRRNKNEYVILQ